MCLMVPCADGSGSNRRHPPSRNKLGELCRYSMALKNQLIIPSLHVEEAEDKLVQCTETAIGLMKAVLENVSWQKTLSRILPTDS